MMDMVNTWDEFCAQSILDVKLSLFLSLPPRLTFQNYFFPRIVGNQLTSIYRLLLSSGTEIIIISVILELTKIFSAVLSWMVEVALVRSSCTFPLPGGSNKC